MAFVKYNTKDNANSTLLVGISAGATSLGIQAGNGTRFPSSNFIATIVQYTTVGVETSAVVKREKVLVSNNATNTFTITRGFGGDTPVAFNAGDSIYLNHVSAIDVDMQDEITRLEGAKLNLGALRTGLANAWRLFFSNGSNAETALAFGTSGTVLTSNGATSAPTFEVPTVSIVGLSEDTTGNMAVDYLIKYDGTNKKILVNKYMASDAEVLAGTSQSKFLNPKQLDDSKFNLGLSASNTLQVSADTERSTTNTSDTKVKEIKIGYYPNGGTVRVTFNIKTNSSNGYWAIYKNGVSITNGLTASTTYTPISYDLSVASGDLVQLYIHAQSAAYNTAYANNFRLSYDLVKPTKYSTVITD